MCPALRALLLNGDCLPQPPLPLDVTTPFGFGQCDGGESVGCNFQGIFFKRQHRIPPPLRLGTSQNAGRMAAAWASTPGTEVIHRAKEQQERSWHCPWISMLLLFLSERNALRRLLRSCYSRTSSKQMIVSSRVHPSNERMDQHGKSINLIHITDERRKSMII